MHRKKLSKPADPSVITNDMCDQVEKLCQLGMSDAELADFFSVSEKTIGDWYLDHAGFRAAVIEGRAMQTARVADAMYQRALGFSYTEEKSHVIDGEIQTVSLRKQALPDVGAQARILAAHRPDTWGNKQVNTLQGPNGESLQAAPTLRVEDMDAEMLSLLKQMLTLEEAKREDREKVIPAE